MFHVEQRPARQALFADAKSPEQSIQHVFGGGPAQKAIKRDASDPQILSDQQGIQLTLCISQRTVCQCNQAVLPIIEGEVAGALTELELVGLVDCAEGRYRRRSGPRA